MVTTAQERTLAAPKRRGPLALLLTRRNAIGLLVGAAARALVPGLGLLPAAAAGLVGRWAYGRAEQRVPFTSRLHVILLPSFAEAALGAALYQKFVLEQAAKRKLLPNNHPDTLLVTGVAQQLIKVIMQGHGGGYQRHLRAFKWEVAVVDEPVMNAFVFPGGKICVYTGLLDLLRRDKDLMAMVMGHEIAHALARHSTEKMGMGLGISVALSIVQAALSGSAGADAGGGGGVTPEQMRARRMYQRQYSRLVHGDEGDEGPGHGHHHAPPGGDAPRLGEELLRALGGAGLSPAPAPAGATAAAAAGPGYRYARAGGGGGRGPAPDALPPWMSDRMVQSMTSVLLQLPFSRRAETEADLIGLKLMALAGYNANKGPEAFKLLASAAGGDRKRHVGGPDALIAGLGCTHPDSNNRAEVLARELAWMAGRARGDASAVEAVGQKLDYWAL